MVCNEETWSVGSTGATIFGQGEVENICRADDRPRIRLFVCMVPRSIVTSTCLRRVRRRGVGALRLGSIPAISLPRIMGGGITGLIRGERILRRAFTRLQTLRVGSLSMSECACVLLSITTC